MAPIIAARLAGAGNVRRTQTVRREEMRHRLLEAAVALLGAKGYAGFRTADLAHEAGVSQGALTHHFRSKDALVLAALEHAFRKAAEHGTKQAHRGKTVDDVLRMLLEDSRGFFFSDLFLIAMELAIFARTDSPSGAEIRAISRANRIPVEVAWLEALIASGVPRANAEDLLWLTISIVRGLAVRRLWQDKPARFKRLMLLWRRMVADHLKVTLPGSGRWRRGTADA